MKKQNVEIQIYSFGNKGNGLGCFSSAEGVERQVEVPFTMPQDRLIGYVYKKKGKEYQAILEQILEPSIERIPPKCIHFGQCGGCRWQHLAYRKQLEVKEMMIKKLLSPSAIEITEWLPIIPCEPPWRYRNKMEFTFSMNRAGDRFLGLMISGSKGKVLPLSECHLVSPWFVKCLNRVHIWWEQSGLSAYYPAKNFGSLQTLIIREGARTGDRMVMLTVSGNPDFALKAKDLERFVEAVKEFQPTKTNSTLSVFLRIRQSIKGRPIQFYEIHLHGAEWIVEKLEVGNKTLEFQISPQAFFQPNTGQAEQIYRQALEMANVEGQVVYDLYCGTGTLGICAASAAKKVVGVELCRESVLDGRENIKRNGLENIEILEGDVGQVLQTLPKNVRPEVVFLDPPRAGLGGKASEMIAGIGPSTILYVSCNPVSQAEDMRRLKEYGYTLAKVQPVDQFPHTYHVETLALLKRDREQ